MKKTSLFAMMLGIIMAFSFNANAQNDKKENKRQFNPEKMVQMRATKIAEDLKLDDATTAKFIEVYKEYLKETHEVFAKNGKPMMGKKDEKARKTDAEVEKEIKDQFATSRALIDVREKYYNKFRTFLSPQQIKVIYEKDRNNASHMKMEKNRRNMDGKGPRKGHRDDMHKHHKGDMKDNKEVKSEK
ncbi:hypothetical protein [Sodaliphilus sp.]|uniref:hypothetical protein n=1 Tax=Sodaliphilus sp. TaxID=2815818 RepID=UPI00388E3F8A